MASPNTQTAMEGAVAASLLGKEVDRLNKQLNNQSYNIEGGQICRQSAG
jgi:hypothetical protein